MEYTSYILLIFKLFILYFIQTILKIWSVFSHYAFYSVVRFIMKFGKIMQQLAASIDQLVCIGNNFFVILQEYPNELQILWH